MREIQCHDLVQGGLLEKRFDGLLEPGEGERLGHHPDRDGSLVEIGSRGQRLGAVLLEEAVDLIGHEADPAGTALVAEPAPLVGARQHARGVVRGVHDDHPGVVVEGADEPVDIERPAVLLLQQVQPDLRADRASNLIERLVAGPGDHDVIARLQERGVIEESSHAMRKV